MKLAWSCMRKNWAFRSGLALIPACGVAYIAGVPIVLALLVVAAMGCLLAGLFKYAISDTGVLDLFFLTIAAAFLSLVAGRGLFSAVEAIAGDNSGDRAVGSIALCFLAGDAAAFIYGVVRRIRSRRPAR